MTLTRRPKSAEEWEREVPPGGARLKPDWNDKPTIAFHLRFNAAEMEELRAQADIACTSKQQLLRSLARDWLTRRRAKVAQSQDGSNA